MGLVLTDNNDTVQVTVETPGGDFEITVGAIPYEIGKQIDELNVKMLKVIRQIKAGVGLEQCSIEMNQIKDEIDLLYITYGLRGHSGLEYANGSEIPCEIEEDGGVKKLTETTLNLYKGNPQYLAKASGKMARVRKVGIGRYVSELANGKDAKEIEEDILGSVEDTAPLAKELERSLMSSIISPTQSESE